MEKKYQPPMYKTAEEFWDESRSGGDIGQGPELEFQQESMCQRLEISVVKMRSRFRFRCDKNMNARLFLTYGMNEIRVYMNL